MTKLRSSLERICGGSDGLVGSGDDVVGEGVWKEDDVVVEVVEVFEVDVVDDSLVVN